MESRGNEKPRFIAGEIEVLNHVSLPTLRTLNARKEQNTPRLRADVQKLYDILIEHECLVVPSHEKDMIMFPEGTTSQRLYPTSTETRYRVMLPDKTELRLIERNKTYTLMLVLPDDDDTENVST